uniref:RPA43 OB domain-containing protein n=1 Tax=Anopheles atroparvus TaxID=41427 RepID=A0A182J4P3_ANOAO
MHRTTIAKYTKFSAEELKKSANDPLSCVTEVQSNEILSLRPRDCEHIVKGVRRCVTDKIGRYHPKVNGIILGYAKIRIENTLSAFRTDSPYLHVRATIDYYVFQPRIGSTLRGTVNYVSKAFVSAMIYQVFNVTVKLNGNANTRGAAVKKGSEISFKVNSCDMKSEIPIIDGELVQAPAVSIKQEQYTENGNTTEDVELETTIEEDQLDSGNMVVKEEPNTKKSKKSKRKLNVSEESQPITNGDTLPQSGGAHEEPQVDKAQLIQSLLDNMFADLNEEPSASKKKKNKSKKESNSSKEQNHNGETISSKRGIGYFIRFDPAIAVRLAYPL